MLIPFPPAGGNPEAMLRQRGGLGRGPGITLRLSQTKPRATERRTTPAVRALEDDMKTTLLALSLLALGAASARAEEGPKLSVGYSFVKYLEDGGGSAPL